MTASAGEVPLDGEGFTALMAGLGGFERHPRLAVGVSGGGDSMALTLLAQAWAEARGGTILALTVDHGLRSESAAEAATVAQRLRARGIAHEILVWDGPKPVTAIEETARIARRALLVQRCRDHGILHLALAHNREDLAETVLMRIARGSGVDGLAGMATIRYEGALRILRPLLGQSRAGLRAVCTCFGESWIDDPSNGNGAYARGRLRAAAGVLAAEGLRPERLVDTARRSARARNALEMATAGLLGGIAGFHPEGWALLAVEGLLNAPAEIGQRALARVIACVGGLAYAPRDEAIARRMTDIRNGLQAMRTLGGCVLICRRESIVIGREPEAAADVVELSPGATVLWDHRFEITLDAAAAGPVTVAKLGEDGWRRAAEVRADLVRLGMPLPVRLALPGLWQGRHLVGVPRFQPRADRPDDTAYPAQARFTPPQPAAGPAFPVV